MDTKPKTPNHYTDSPDLHPNLILGGFQLLFWLFFHPSAWRNYVARIDPNLRPDFCLTELGREQWRNLLWSSSNDLPLLQRIFQEMKVGTDILTRPWLRLSIPGLLCLSLPWLLSGLILRILGGSDESIVIGMIVSEGISFAVIASGGLGFGVAIGLVASLLGSVIISVVFAMLLNAESSVTVSLAMGTAIGVAGSMAGNVMHSVVHKKQIYSLARQVGGSIVGVMIGSIAISIVSIAAFGLENVVAVALMIGLFGGVASVWIFAIPTNWYRGLVTGTAIGLVFAVGSGLTFGIVTGDITPSLKVALVGSLTFGLMAGLGAVAVGFLNDWRLGLITGTVGGTVSGLAVSVAFGVINVISASAANSLTLAGFFAILVVLPYSLARHIAGFWAGIMAGVLTGGGGWIISYIFINDAHMWPALPCGLLSILLGLSCIWWYSIVLYPFLIVWNLLLYRADEHRNEKLPCLLRYHSAFWDEHQRLPLLGLDEHLVLVIERNSAEGQAALEYLTTSRQRWAAQRAQIELDARRLERCTNATTIGSAHQSLAAGELEGPASALLRSFSRISQDVVAALQQESAYNQRLALSAVEDRLDGLLRELTRSSDRYAVRFRPIAHQWRQAIAEHVRELAQAVELRQEIDIPYIIGVPLTARQEIFVGRAGIVARIEQLLLDRRRPPLLLYGQRRMGKTSLLNNLGRLLPSTIVSLFIDLQGPASRATDHAGFLYSVARGIVASAGQQRDMPLPPLSREELAADPFVRFEGWLDQVESALGSHTALLALDEFEALDRAITRGRFVEDEILGLLRHIIQHRPCFKVLISGSHTLDELERWASYLINVQVVHVGYLKEDEARQLVEHPVQDFTLRYEPDASQRAIALTRGHPFLVQLLCAEIVALKNEQPVYIRRLARIEDVEAAVPEALRSGSFFFADIQRNQVDPTGLALLRHLAAQGEGATASREQLARHHPTPTDLDHTIDLLTRRELIEPSADGYRFQVELVRRWFAR